MNRQKSFDVQGAKLYIVATPIGNLQEMTPRAVSVLSEVDVVACEDTRTTRKLLTHFEINTTCISHHMHNELHSAQGIIQLMEEGKSVALVSDAGYPLVSDPGQNLVELASQAGFPVIPISGANAMLNALVASGNVAMPFYFKGFLASSSSGCKKECEKLKTMDCTMIFYEAPHRLTKTLTIMAEIFGNRKVCVARELTKRHEEFIRGTLEEFLEEKIGENIKGEIVLIVEGAVEEEVTLDLNQVKLLVEEKVAQGLPKSQAIKELAKQMGVSKNTIYDAMHEK